MPDTVRASVIGGDIVKAESTSKLARWPIHEAMLFLVVGYILTAPLIISTWFPTDALKWAVIQLGGPALLAALVWTHLRTDGAFRVDMLGWILLGTLAVKALSITDARVPGLGIEQLSRYAGLVATYFLVTWVCRSARDRDIVLWAVTGLGFLIAAYGILQHFGIDFYPWIEHREVPTSRGSSWFGHATFSASALIMTLPVALGVASTRTTFWLRQIARLAALLMVYHLSFSGARFATASLLFAAFTAIALAMWNTARHGRGDDFSPNTPLLRLGSMVTLVAVGIVGGTIFYRAVQEKGGDVLGIHRADLAQRVMTWEAASRMFMDHPVNGIGTGQFVTELPAYWNKYEANRYAAFQRISDQAHNEYLEMAAEEGFPGIALMLAVWVTALYQAYTVYRFAEGIKARRIGLALFAALLANGIDAAMIFNRQIAGPAMTTFVLLGVTSYCYRNMGDVKVDETAS